MPSLADLRKNLLSAADQEPFAEQTGEAMIVDSRAYLSPSQQVDRKLRGTLNNNRQVSSLRINSIRPYPKPR